MSQTDQPPPGAPAKPKRKSAVDRWVKLGFALVFLAAVGAVLYLQFRGPMLGWGGNLDKALAQAKGENRRVVVFVRSFPVGEDDKWMVLNTLDKKENLQALEEGRFIKVELVLRRSADWAKKFGVTVAPTMLVIDPDGQRFHRQEGRIGETAFRQEFLKATPTPDGAALPVPGRRVPGSQ